jgi:hypothetical protein
VVGKIRHEVVISRWYLALLWPNTYFDRLRSDDRKQFFFFPRCRFIGGSFEYIFILNSKMNSQFVHRVQVLDILDVVSGINYRSNKIIKILKFH